MACINIATILAGYNAGFRQGCEHKLKNYNTQPVTI